MSSTPEAGPAKNGGVKTLAIRLEPELHAQLSLIAQLRASSITDEIRQAIEAHITGVKAAPEIAGRASSVLEDIEREAAARRQAISALFGTTDEVAPTPPSGRSRARKTADSPAADR